MRCGCLSVSMEYVRDAFAWDSAVVVVVVLEDQCTSSAVHLTLFAQRAGWLRRCGG